MMRERDVEITGCRPRNSINAIENGRFDPSLPLAFRIAGAFGLTVEEVFDKTDV